MVASTLTLAGISPSVVSGGIQNPYALAQEEEPELGTNTNVSITNDSAFPPGREIPLTTNESLLLGEMLNVNENVTGISNNITSMRSMSGIPDNILSTRNISGGVIPTNITSTGNTSGVVQPPPPAVAPPSVVHLRVQVHSITVNRDHDGSARGDGEWHLLGVVSCCGGAINSNTPTTGFSFNAPGAVEGEIDTPDDRMNDVTGERRGSWGTRETVTFADVKQDIDVDNTNPLAEIGINFFGIENDKIGLEDLPPIADIKGTNYDEYAQATHSVIVFLNNLASTDHLGNVHNTFTRAQNYGFFGDGGGGTVSSDRIHSNHWFKSEANEIACSADVIGADCTAADWPDYPDYVIHYSITDRDGPRCAPGFNFIYATGVCEQIIVG